MWRAPQPHRFLFFMCLLTFCSAHAAGVLSEREYLDLSEKFREGVVKAKDVVRDVRHPVALDVDVTHTYDTKFAVMEFMSRAVVQTLRSTLRVAGADAAIDSIGVDADTIKIVFTVQANCTFYQERWRHLGPLQHLLGMRPDVFVWRLATSVRLAVHTRHRIVSVPIDVVDVTEVFTYRHDFPHPAVGEPSVAELDLRWLAGGNSTFRINRTRASCHTPSRNREVLELLAAVQSVGVWAKEVQSLADWRGTAGEVSLCGARAFVPVLPLVDMRAEEAPYTALPEMRLWEMRQEQEASLRTELAACQARLEGEPAVRPIIATLARYLVRVAQTYVDAFHYMEALIREQMVRALGTHITEQEFQAFLGQHIRSIFADSYTVKGFSRAVRVEGRSPEGSIAIVRGGGARSATAIDTIAKTVDVQVACRLHAAAAATLAVPVHVHTAVEYSFAGGAVGMLRLVADAREFSSFVLIIGTVQAGELTPTAALVVKNRATLDIPLHLETIPSASAFKEYTSSLSPEQRQFAQAYRRLQLSSSIFAASVVQLKPLFESALGLPAGSLTKDFQLMQQLSDLFVEHDMSASLLAYDPIVDGPASDTVAKVACVRRHVETVLSYIHDEQARHKASTETPKAEPHDAHEGMHHQVHNHNHNHNNVQEKDADEGERDGGGVMSMMAEAVGRVTATATMPMMAKMETKRRVQHVARDLAAKTAVQTEMKVVPDAPSVGSGAGEAKRDAAQRSAHSPADDVIASLPHQLDAGMAKYDLANSLRPTIITPGQRWKLRSRKSIAAPFVDSELTSDERLIETQRTLGLLDTLTQGGVRAITEGELHIIVPLTHVFDTALLEYAVVRNKNPLHLVEESVVLAASILHNISTRAVLKPEHFNRMQEFAPYLFL